MVKKHLKNIVRKSNPTDKHKYNYVLAQNERNLELPSELQSKFLSSLSHTDFAFYPNLDPLKYKIREYSKCNNILLTPGSDFGIKTIFEVYELENKEILTTDYFFPMYKVYADIHNAKLITSKYKSQQFNIKDLINSITENTALIIIANPNSPIGDTYTLAHIEQLLDIGIPTVIDEAYIELSNAKSSISLVDKYSNLYVTRTFSKGFGAAGCRVGYICTNSANLAVLEKLRLMYEISGVSAKYCEFILDNLDYFNEYLNTLLLEKNLLYYKLIKANHLVFNTNSSWIFIKHTEEVANLISKHKVDIRSNVLTFKGNSVWYKLNYDATLKDSKFINELTQKEDII